jgi:signal transduction histidine kinase
VTVRLERQQAALIIEVSDKGPGIPRDDRTRVFRPFYTTKKRGVGIGLFIVKQVVENDFGGTITISGDEQKGTVMTVVLPKSFYGRP